MSSFNQNIILASSSFLRKLLMKSSKLEFSIQDMDIDESQFEHLEINERVLKTALAKAKKAKASNEDSIVIAGDTLTVIVGTEGEEFVEDKNNKKGSEFLNGQSMHVVTATVVITVDGAVHSDVCTCEVLYTKTGAENLKRITENDTVLRGGSLGVYSDSPGFSLIKNVNGAHGALYGLNMPFIYQAIGVS